MQIGAVTEEAACGFVSHVEGEEAEGPDGSTAAALALTEHSIFFNFDEILGFAIVDTGATRSMAGIRQFIWLQDLLNKELGHDPLEIDETKVTTFTYANGAKGSSYGRCGVPHPVALEEQGGVLWFTLVETDSPTLLGLDYLSAAGADCLSSGVLSFPDGHQEPLVQLKSGHWALPLV